jgi:4-aminobutyrate aminotransferase-like enzyme
MAPDGLFKAYKEVLDEHGILLISDEVQTGWGRTGGKWFGIEQWGVTPDIITSAKGLGNGSPVGLTVARPEIADSLKGATISTFGGNPVTATAAKAVIDYIDDNNLMINAAETGAYLRGKLEEMKGKYSIIGDVRGMGLMQALELVEDRETKKPAVDATLAVMEMARENRLLIGKGGTLGNVIRLSPPLNISKSDVDDFALRLDASLKQVTQKQMATA